MKTVDKGVKYPLTLGHKIAGIIESIAEDVEGFAKNEKVIVFPSIGEGLSPCRIGKENLCDNPDDSKLQIAKQNGADFGRELSRYGMLEFVNIRSINFCDQLAHHQHVEYLK